MEALLEVRRGPESRNARETVLYREKYIFLNDRLDHMELSFHSCHKRLELDVDEEISPVEEVGGPRSLQ